MDHIYDVIILGAGPAGLSAGLYAGRSRLDTLIIEKGQAGGQIINTDEIENYPGQIVEGETGVAKREVSFSDVGDYLVSQFATTDNYSTDFQIFTLNGLSVGVENDLLSEALRELPDKKREILLLFYFMDMSDSEIADLLKLNRSTVYRHRTSGLALIKKFMEEFEE